MKIPMTADEKLQKNADALAKAIDDIEFPIEHDFTDPDEINKDADDPDGGKEEDGEGTDPGDGGNLFILKNKTYALTLARIKGYPETKTVMKSRCIGSSWYKVCTKWPVIYYSMSTIEYTFTVTYPEIDGRDLQDDIIHCLKEAVIAGGITFAVTMNVGAASEALVADLKACLSREIADLVNQVRGKLDRKMVRDWKKVF